MNLLSVLSLVASDRGWANQSEMKAACLASWVDGNQGCVARGQTQKEGEALVAALAENGVVASFEEDEQELCYKAQQKALMEHGGLPRLKQRVGIKGDTDSTKACTILAADRQTGQCTAVYDDGD